MSKLCHEPRVALAVLESMLAPHRAAGRLTVLTETVPEHADTDGDRVRAVRLRDREGGTITVTAPYVLDATEDGALLPLTGTEYVTGAEGQDEHGEPHAPEQAQPDNHQSLTVCFAIDNRPGEDHTIDRPQRYDFWRAYRPDFWPNRLLDLTAPDPKSLQPVPRTFTPDAGGDPLSVFADQSREGGDRELWTFRRILAKGLFTDGAIGSDVTLVNWPMNDYWLGRIIDIEEPTARAHLYEARQLSLSLLYWLQTEAPRPDGGTGYPGLRLRPDVVGTADGLAKAPYLRESRRIRAKRTITEHDVALDLVGPRGSTRYPDSVGVGAYRIDLHPSTGGDNYIDIASTPFEIPLSALLPVRTENLLPAAKNIGTTHITNGCYRLHPVEWNIGEVAGGLAAFCLRTGRTPAAVQADSELLADFQRVLDRTGVERHWPDVRGY